MALVSPTLTMCLLVTCGQYGQKDMLGLYADIQEHKIQGYAHTQQNSQ